MTPLEAISLASLQPMLMTVSQQIRPQSLAIDQGWWRWSKSQVKAFIHKRLYYRFVLSSIKENVLH